MARPEEKAQNMLNKWVKMRQEEEERGGDNAGAYLRRNQKRPHLARLCTELHDAEKFRRDIVREISDGIRKIQNAGMGEHAIRDLNDEINRLIREKYHWNNRIKELGGTTDYNALERKQARSEGDLQDGLGLKGSGGYRYFGAAKELPGVKELFARHAAKLTKRKRGDVYKYITPDYYGIRDEEDGVLLELEERAGKKLLTQLEREREAYRKSLEESGLPEWEDESDEEDDLTVSIGGVTGAQEAIAAHVAVPTQEIVAKTVLEQKKKELLERLSL